MRHSCLSWRLKATSERGGELLVQSHFRRHGTWERRKCWRIPTMCRILADPTQLCARCYRLGGYSRYFIMSPFEVKLDCRIFWTLWWRHESSMETRRVFCIIVFWSLRLPLASIVWDSFPLWDSRMVSFIRKHHQSLHPNINYIKKISILGELSL